MEDRSSISLNKIQYFMHTVRFTSANKDEKQFVATLRKNVTSPNGTTAAALKVFSDSNLEKIVADAMAAAKKRAQELA